MASEQIEIEGLGVHLDKVIYRYDPENAPEGRPHLFIYFVTIRNYSDRAVTLVGRRWVLTCRDGHTMVVEGEGVVGEKPRLRPGESYSISSFHMVSASAVAQGSFHGVDSSGRHIVIRIPAFPLQVPQRAR